MKNLRQEKILELISKYDISTQEALIAKLAEEGFVSTQTTVSRDIRQLNLIKSPVGNGSYKYVVAGSQLEKKLPGHTSSLGEAVLKIESAENIVVIKTLAGMANAIAVCTENVNPDGFVGSVAGDDTIIMVFKNAEKAFAGEAELNGLFKH